jgi:signal transduction histidine kinase
VTLAGGQLPDCIGDEPMLAQLWTRLLSNARRYTRERETARVEVGYSAPAKAYFVRDNGVGFDPRYADKMFNLFERLHRDDSFEGTGVGLALAARIVRRHGGRIWAETRPQGAMFWFSIPPRAT